MMGGILPIQANRVVVTTYVPICWCSPYSSFFPLQQFRSKASRTFSNLHTPPQVLGQHAGGKKKVTHASLWIGSRGGRQFSPPRSQRYPCIQWPGMQAMAKSILQAEHLNILQIYGVPVHAGIPTQVHIVRRKQGLRLIRFLGFSFAH